MHENTNRLSRALLLDSANGQGLCVVGGEPVGTAEPNSLGLAEATNRSNAKTRNCKVCKSPFQPMKAMQKVCGFGCAVDLGVAEKQKAQRKLELTVRRADKVKREKLKTRGDWIKEAQIEFNKYVRLRDSGQGCISCGSACGEGAIGGSGDAGHFRSRGSAPHLRFDERNCHLQCKRCNRYLSGNVADYRTGLVKRIGLDAVMTLEADQEPRRHTVDDLKAIKQKYAALTRELRGKE